MQMTPAVSPDMFSEKDTSLISEHKRLELEGKIYEPLLAENPGRFVIFPIQHQDVSSLTGELPSVVWNHLKLIT
jgi:hypothetical protein